MSKSISGSGSLNLTVQELRFLEIKATLISAINATIDNLLTAVNANFTGLVTVTNLTISGTVTVQNMTVLNTLTAEYIVANQGITGDLTGAVNIETTTPTNTGAFRVPFIDGVNDGVTSTGNGLMSSSNKLRFDESTGTLLISNYVSVPIMAVTTYAIITPTTSTEDAEYAVAMFGNGNELTGDSMTYNCFQNRLTVPNLQVTAALTLASLTVGGNVVATNITTTNITVTGQVEVNPVVATGNSDLKVPFLNASDQIRVGSVGKPLTFNPNQGILKSHDLDLLNDLTVGGSTTICSKDKTATSELCRLLFLDGQSTIGTNYDIVRDDFLYYKPSSTLLVGNSIRGQVQMITPLITLLGANNVNGGIDIYDDGTAVRNRYFHQNGHLFMDGNMGNNLFMTNTTQTRVYNPLQCDDDVTIAGTLTASVLNIGTQTATNFSVVNDITVGGHTILSNTPTASGSTPLSILLLGTNKIQRGSITFNPLSNLLSTTNVGLTGNLTSSIVTTTTLTASTLDLSGDLTLTNLPNTITTGVSYSLLYKNNTTDEVHETSPSLISIGKGLTDVFIKTERIVADTFQCGNGLPIGYTSIYSCGTWATNFGTFGQSVPVELSRNASEGGTPRVSQYGANIASSLSNPIWSAIKYPQGSNASTYWGLANVAYAGIWRLDLTAVFQNLSSARLTPKIMIQKYINGTTWIDQPQMSVGVQYTRTSSGELSALRCEGVCYLTTASEVLRIVTLLEIDTVNNPPTYPDIISSNLWAGREINISMQFLGTGTSTTGEIVNAL